jgi:RimJ/RimL family protein N-acetyltransferase
MRIVRFVPYCEDDLPLTAALELDASVKRSLGGPLEPAGAARVHQRRLERMAEGDLFFTITVDDRPDPVGVAAIFQTPWQGATIFEAGVMLLPGFQARGVGVEALRMLTDLARTRMRLPELHGFTAVTNHAGNSICRKLRWQLVGECDLDYEGRPLRCNHWVFPLVDRP